MSVEAQLLSVSQFSCLTGVSATTIYRKIARGDIPSASVAGQIRIPTWYLEELTGRPGDLPTWIKGETDND
jgi:excisionase family DNA binding protein